ncbi:VOC family protein [Salisediminibacterium halotolerans]|nr:VOC family protein [Salisediminibacterium halotolerans]
MVMKHVIQPCLWFDNHANEAADYYSHVFQQCTVLSASPMTVQIEIEGLPFTLLNGGPHFTPNPSISFFITYESEAELDAVWNKLLPGGELLMPLAEYEWSKKYGWIQDRYGISWHLSLGRISDTGQKTVPFLLFVNEQYGLAEKAVDHYTAIFDDSFIDGILRYSEEERPERAGSVKHGQFGLKNEKFMIMESSDDHRFSMNEAISLIVYCKTQKEVDYYWEQLTRGGREVQCGWLKDAFGVSWQVCRCN